MALTELPAATQNAYLGQRRGKADADAKLYSALVSDIEVDDFIWGCRGMVTAVQAVAGGNRTITILRRGDHLASITMAATSTVWIAR